MKLEKFKEKDQKKRITIGISIVLVLLVAGIIVYKSFAFYEEKKAFDVIKGQVPDQNYDLMLSYYVENEYQETMPKGKDYSVSVTCTNGATGVWDYEAWGPVITNLTSTRTKCKIIFAPDNFADYIKYLAKTNDNLAYDGTKDNNLRYVGSSPDNYVFFGETYQTDIYDLFNSEAKFHFGLSFANKEECESFKNSHSNYTSMICEKTHSKGDKILWRVIGAMNNIDDGTGKKETRVKIIRNESIGPWSWNSSELSVNNGWGVNEWSVSDIKTVLNDYYYNGLANQTCKVINKNQSIPCDFSKIGLSINLKNLISDAVWNTGSDGSEEYDAINTSRFYELERSNNTGKLCSSSGYCNDTVTRTIKWTGKVGLMYPSDYGYATKGGNTTNRDTCINEYLRKWHLLSDCWNNDWLYNDSVNNWTMMPSTDSRYAYAVTVISKYGTIKKAHSYMGLHYSEKGNGEVYMSRPTVFLKSNVKIKDGNGSLEQPFVLLEK